MKKIMSMLLIMIMVIGILPSNTFANNEAFVSFRIYDASLKDHIPIDQISDYKVYVDNAYFNTFNNRFRFDYGMATVGRTLHVAVEMDGYQRYEGDFTVIPDPGTGIENDFLIYLNKSGAPVQDMSAQDTLIQDTPTQDAPTQDVPAQDVQSGDTAQTTFTRSIDVGTLTVEAKELGIKIDLPNYAIDAPTEIVIKKISDSHSKGIPETVIYKEVIEVKLGDIHNLSGFATIAMPYNPSKIPTDVLEEEYISARYLNEETDQWEHIYYEVDSQKHVLYIKTDHLSKFALLMGDLHSARDSATSVINPEAFVVETKNESDITTALKALDANLKSISDFKLVEATEFILGTKSLEPIKDGLKHYGKGKKIFAIHEGIWATGKQTPEAKKAVLDAAKAIFDYGMDELISISSAASAGVAIIDYSLTKFVNAAFEGNEKVYYNAYTDFYNTIRGPGVKSIKEWISIIEPMIDPKNPQDLSRKLDEYIVEYLNEIWDGGDNEGWFDDQVHASGKNFAYQSLLTPAMKVKLADRFKPVLYNTRIVPALTQIREKQMEAAEQALDDMYWDLEMYLVLPNGVRVDFQEPAGHEGTYSLDKVKISLLDANYNVVKNQALDIKFKTNAKEVRFTLMELLHRKVNIEFVKVEMPLHDGTYKTETIALPFNPFEVEFGEVGVMLPENYVEFEPTSENTLTEPSGTETAGNSYTINLAFYDVTTREQLFSDINLKINGVPHDVSNGVAKLKIKDGEANAYKFEFSTDGYDSNRVSLNSHYIKRYDGGTYNLYLKHAEEVAVEESAPKLDSYHNIAIRVQIVNDNHNTPPVFPETVNVVLNGTLYTGLELENGRAFLKIPRSPGPFHNDPIHVEVTLPGVGTKTIDKTSASVTSYYFTEIEDHAYSFPFQFYVPGTN